MANLSYGSVTVTTSPTQVLPARGRRQGFIIQNKSSQEVYFGHDDSITTSNTISILSGGYFNESLKQAMLRTNIYAVVASGTADVRFWEWGE